jgi:hypothetical protein
MLLVLGLLTLVFTRKCPLHWCVLAVQDVRFSELCD